MFTIDAADFRRRGLRCLAAIAAGAWLAAPTTARAAIVVGVKDFVLSNVTAVLDGTPASISGSFTRDGAEEWLASVEVTGGRFAGSYSWPFSDPLFTPVGTDLEGGDGGAGKLQMSFANLLSSPGNPAVTSVVIDGVAGTDLTGTAVMIGQDRVYSFVDASAVLDGETESITGNFGYDPTTDIEYGAEISITPSLGQCVFDIELVGEGHGMDADCGGIFPQIKFADTLSSTPDPLAEVLLPPFFDRAPKGVVVCGEPCPAAAVPEPSTLATLGAALGLFFLSLSAGRPNNGPDRPVGS